MTLCPIEQAVATLAAGEMIILVDDEDRENEGDLVIAAQAITPEAINFMAKHGRGLICLTLNQQRVEELGLPLMAQQNGTRHQTAFTVSIEAREGVTTGISAADRAHTIQTAINPTKKRQDIVTPGHVFPLVARDGGVLVRAGHTEASVDMARLAGLYPAAVICEIMNDDGTMARLPDLMVFAQQHQLKIATIADLIAWRRRQEKLVDCVHQCEIQTKFGTFALRLYRDSVTMAEHIALIKGSIQPTTPTIVRMHSVNILHDILGDTSEGREGEIHDAMQYIAEAGTGVLVLLREARVDYVSRLLINRDKQEVVPSILRDYGIGAQILLDIGVQQMILLSNHKKNIVGLEGYGLEVVSQQPLHE